MAEWCVRPDYTSCDPSLITLYHHTEPLHCTITLDHYTVPLHWTITLVWCGWDPSLITLDHYTCTVWLGSQQMWSGHMHYSHILVFSLTRSFILHLITVHFYRYKLKFKK